MIRAALIVLFSAAFSWQTFSQDATLRRLSDEQLLDALGGQRSPAEYVVSEGSQSRQTGEKCGFGLRAEAYRRLGTMTGQKLEALKKIMERPDLETSVVSSSGRFRVYFDLSGIHEPALLGDGGVRIPGTAREYAGKVAEYLDESYDVEVTQLGYNSPPFETGYSQYNVYLLEFGGQLYGQTVFGEPTSSGTARPTYTTYIEMDNDFRGYYSSGLEGAQVTVAHEFHHMVQLGTYGFWDFDVYMYEMTSTYFEDVVFTDVNDYLQYLDAFMKYPGKSLYVWDGYECVLWPKMMEEKFGPEMWRDVWVEMRRSDPLRAMETVLNRQRDPSELGEQFCNFSRWNYYTDYRLPEDAAIPTYPESSTYPTVKMTAEQNIVAGAVTFTGALPPMSTDYLRAIDGVDTVSFSVANIHKQMMLDKANFTAAYTLTVKRYIVDPRYTKLEDDWSYLFEPALDNALCLNQYDVETIGDKGIPGVYPNPFDPVADGILRFPLEADVVANTADLYIYSTAMNLVRKQTDLNVRRNEIFGVHIAWDGKTETGKTTPSGVYFYTVAFGGEVLTGKFAVITR